MIKLKYLLHRFHWRIYFDWTFMMLLHMFCFWYTWACTNFGSWTINVRVVSFSQKWLSFWLAQGHIKCHCKETPAKFDIFLHSFLSQSPSWHYCVASAANKQIQLHSYDIASRPVYDGKWVLFKVVLCSVKVLPSPGLDESSRQLLRPFKWGTVWLFISRGIKTDTTWRFRLSTLPNKSRPFGEF